MIIQFNNNFKSNWTIKKQTLLKRIEEALTYADSRGVDFEIEIRSIRKKRSGQQLKAYWVLISSIQKWMNSKGNSFTQENISDWFKIRSGHCLEIKSQVLPKSIAKKSDCSIEQMEKLITEILQFGAENDVPDCDIEDQEFKQLLEYYKE